MWRVLHQSSNLRESVFDVYFDFRFYNALLDLAESLKHSIRHSVAGNATQVGCVAANGCRDRERLDEETLERLISDAALAAIERE